MPVSASVTTPRWWCVSLLVALFGLGFTHCGASSNATPEDLPDVRQEVRIGDLTQDQRQDDLNDPSDLKDSDADSVQDTTEPPLECTGVFRVEDLDGNPVEMPAGGTEGLDWIFDQTLLRDYTLEIEQEDLLWLQGHILDEEYVPASLVVGGLRYKGVAARYKGDWTSLYSCVDAATGVPTCPKLSMKLRFNKYDPCGRFHGQRRLVFNANVNDYSMLRERMAYTLMNRMGMTASRVTHSRLRINDGDYSVFTQVEAVDHEFIERRYPDASGNLYKGIWPKSTDPDDYIWTLETNEEEQNVARMVQFAQAVASAENATFTQDLAAFASTEEIARFMAFFVATGEMDGILWFWCHDGDCTSGNYYWYDDPESYFHLLPWDREAAFFSVWDPTWLTPEWWTQPDVCEPQSYYLFTQGAAQGEDDPLIMAPQCDKLLRESILANPAAYLETMQALASQMEWAVSELPALQALLAPAMAADPNLPMTVDKWEDAVGWLGENIQNQKASIETMLQSR